MYMYMRLYRSKQQQYTYLYQIKIKLKSWTTAAWYKPCKRKASWKLFKERMHSY